MITAFVEVQERLILLLIICKTGRLSAENCPSKSRRVLTVDWFIAHCHCADGRAVCRVVDILDDGVDQLIRVVLIWLVVKTVETNMSTSLFSILGPREAMKILSRKCVRKGIISLMSETHQDRIQAHWLCYL